MYRKRDRTRREEITNDKLNITPREIWAVVIAGTAAALCAVIDLLLKEGES